MSDDKCSICDKVRDKYDDVCSDCFKEWVNSPEQAQVKQTPEYKKFWRETGITHNEALKLGEQEKDAYAKWKARMVHNLNRFR